MIELDVRAIPVWERHPRIFAAYDTLAPDDTLVLTSDHEPRPLRAEFERRHSRRYTWVQRRLGDGHWEVRLTRREAHVADGIAGVLAECAPFASLPPHEIETLATQTRRTILRRGECVAEQEEAWPYVGVVEQGVVHAVLSATNGREQALYDVVARDLFGEIALFDRGLMPMRFAAVTNETIVLAIPAQPLRALAARERGVAAALEHVASQHFRAILDDLASALSRSTVARVARTLLDYAAPEPGLRDALEPLGKMTQIDLALRAGTVKEVVNRALGELESAGAVERNGGRITRLDRARLAIFAAD